ncbi:hypothetical protein [Prosthecobacter dejongeii]|nr:hypothetical protein [Prosthecobacter dejongeii]
MKNICVEVCMDPKFLRLSLGFRAFVISSLFALTCLVPGNVLGHHGRDFILVQDSAIPAPLSGVAIAGYEWQRDGDTDSFSTEPGFFIGLASSLAFGLSAGFSDESGDWNYTGITPQFVISLIPPTGPTNFRAGLWAGYEFAERPDDSHTGSVGAHSHSPGSGPDAGGPVAPHSHGGGGHDHGSHGGIHRHGESGFYSRLILESDITERTRAVVNLVSFVSGQGGGPGFGYAAGLRCEIHHDLSLGVEAIGDFRSYGSSHEILLTTMVGLPKHLSLRLGVGGGLTRASPDFTLHTSFLWRF